MESRPLTRHDSMNNPLVRPPNYQAVEQPSHSAVSLACASPSCDPRAVIPCVLFLWILFCVSCNCVSNMLLSVLCFMFVTSVFRLVLCGLCLSLYFIYLLLIFICIYILIYLPVYTVYLYVYIFFSFVFSPSSTLVPV